MYAVTYETEGMGGVDSMFGSYGSAVFKACELFGSILPVDSSDPKEFQRELTNPDFLARVDVFECDSEDDADEQFADALFTPLFHLDNGMDFRG